MGAQPVHFDDDDNDPESGRTTSFELETISGTQGEGAGDQIPFKSRRNSVQKFHIAYDIWSFAENAVLTGLGARYIRDKNIDGGMFVFSVIIMHLLGLLIKSTYYISLHPWMMWTPSHKNFKVIHGVVCMIYILVIGGYAGSTSKAMLSFALSMLALLLFLVMVIFVGNYNEIIPSCRPRSVIHHQEETQNFLRTTRPV